MALPRHLTIYWPLKQAPLIEEAVFSYNFCRHLSRQRCLDNLSPCTWKEYHSEEDIRSAVETCDDGLLLVVTDPEIMLNEFAIYRMVKGLDESGFGICGPVYNDTSYSSQYAQIPARYLNMSTYLELAEMMAEESVTGPTPVHIFDPSCILYDYQNYVKWGRILSFDKESNLKGSDISAGVDKGALIHRFGDYYMSQREDLIALVPDTVKTVLDVGCAMGGYGRLLKQRRPDIDITGVELNPFMAKTAGAYYDEIIVSPIEKVQFSQKFDLINCGDIIEHLNGPWEMLEHLNALLNPGAYLVLSIPNIGHWSVIKDLLKGEFQYIPVGLLCITHLRWFTESSIRQALTDAGFEIEYFHKQQIDPTPEGHKFIRIMNENGYGNTESLLSNEFIIRAVKK